ncbi:dipeptide/oligopeptide/nickel ABC transporter ATP-binding protein [Sulfolobales archaeon HS-7]|nr:dipeptide/oligopeptide/nickel ABC transporter ATP-binding protein [Sulfolobales archaeon HS-7]
MESDDLILKAKDVTVNYRVRMSFIPALRGANLGLKKGGISAVIGESGSGKSTLLSSIVGSLPQSADIRGLVELNGMIIMQNGDYDKRFLSRRWEYISYIPQNSMNVLNPVKTVKSHFIETGEVYGLSKQEISERITQIFDQIGLDQKVLSYYPHQLSGGMKQRVVIALAIFLRPSVTIADEPTSALDMVTQKKILDLLQEINRKYGISMIVATHDIAVASYVADYFFVFYRGKIVEQGSREDVLSHPLHPYTIYLMGSVVSVNGRNKFEHIRDRIKRPSRMEQPKGCVFSDRCPYSREVCFRDEPKLVDVSSVHKVACFNIDEVRKDVYN